MNICNQYEQTEVTNTLTARKSVYYVRLEELFQKYAAGVVTSIERTKVEKAIGNYITAETNQLFQEIGFFVNETAAPLRIKYPNLATRLDRLPLLTEAEVIRFTEVENISIYTYPSLLLEPQQENFLTMLDTFFSPQGTISETAMGAYCSLVPDIFSAFDEVQPLFDSAFEFFDMTDEIIAEIQDIAAKGIVQALKDELNSAIDDIILDYTNQVNTMSPLFFVSAEGSTYNHNMYPAYDSYRLYRDIANSFLGPEVTESIKFRVGGLVIQSVSLFDLTVFALEEAEFLSLRYCEFIGDVEQFFDELLKPLQDIEANFNETYNRLVTSGNPATAMAIGAGAVRLETNVRYQGIESSQAIPSPRISSSGTTPPEVRTDSSGNEVVLSEGEGRNGLSPTNNTSIPVRQRTGNIRPPTPQELAAVPSFEQARGGYNGIRYTPGPISSSGGRDGWEKVQTLEIIMLMRLASAWGRELIINSAYRSAPVGSATKSWHMSGQAFDVSMRGINTGDRERFISLARAEGFGGIGRYSTFIHVDSRAKATSW